MEFQALAAARYSVRKFTGTHLREDQLAPILRAGHLAPTGCNLQPQRILVLNTDAAMERVRRCTRSHFDAPCALLVCCNTEECWRRTRYDGRASGVMDVSIVATHMMLAAADIGVGCTWVMHFDPEATRREFALPDHFDPVAFLMMGDPAPDAAPHVMHEACRPMDEVVFYDSFETV